MRSLATTFFSLPLFFLAATAPAAWADPREDKKHDSYDAQKYDGSHKAQEHINDYVVFVATNLAFSNDRLRNSSPVISVKNNWTDVTYCKSWS